MEAVERSGQTAECAAVPPGAGAATTAAAAAGAVTAGAAMAGESAGAAVAVGAGAEVVAVGAGAATAAAGTSAATAEAAVTNAQPAAQVAPALGVSAAAAPSGTTAAPNAALDLIEQRSSTRQFAQNTPVTGEQRAAVLHAASRAPSAGAMMMYSIIDIRAQETLDRLAVLCDNQPFIATAPWALIFVVDYAKWIDLFEHVGCFEPAFVQETGRAPRRTPGLGELGIALQDTVIAAQNAAIAAEAVGLGSCYIGDIIENAEGVAQLLDLPPYTLPLSMLVLGTPAKARPATPHPVENLVMPERYRRADAATLDRQVAEMDAMFRPHARTAGERVRDIYTRKHTSPFMAEMGRSMACWLKNWTGEASLQG